MDSSTLITSAVDSTDAVLTSTPGPSDPKPSQPPLYIRIPFLVAAVLSVLVALISYRYVLGVGFVPPNIAANTFYPSALVIHVVGSATALLVGPFQFVKAIRSRYLRVHRISGRVYVFGCLLGGLAALPLSWGASAGSIAITGFLLLAVLWLVFTTNAVRLAILGRIAEHREWMLRSFALTYGAVTLRLYMQLLPRVFGMSFEQGYIVSAWASWVLNLIVAEAYIHHTRSAVVKPLPAATAAV